MKPRTRRFRRALLSVVPLVVFAVTFDWMSYTVFQRAKLKPLLIAAVQAKDAGRVKHLLDRGADPNARCGSDTGARGLRRFFMAVLGRDPEAKSNRGKTVLMVAAENEDRESVCLLLERGANPNARDELENTALLAAACGGPRVRELGRHDDGNLRQRLPVYDVLKMLLDAGAAVDQIRVEPTFPWRRAWRRRRAVSSRDRGW